MMELAVWQGVLLAATASLTAVASAVLAVSAYLVVFPVLVSALEMDAIQAVFVCFIIDLWNGLVICFWYRRSFADTEPVAIVVGLVACLVAAVACAATYGIGFIKSNGGSLGVGVSAVVIFMGLMFLRRAYRLPKSGASSEGPAGLEIVADSGVKPELKSDDVEKASNSEVDQRATKSAENAASKSGVRWVLFALVFAWGGVAMGTFGFGGGNFIALCFIIIKKWGLLPSTAAGGLISFLTLFSLATLFVYRQEVDWNALKVPLSVVLPFDGVLVVLATSFAKKLPEREMTFAVGIMLALLGSFAVIYGAVVK